MATKSIRVRATKLCSVNGHRRRGGDEFFIFSEKQFGKNYMEKIEGPVAKQDAAKSNGELNVKELKAALVDRGISFPASANKPVLVELLNEAEGLGDTGKEDDETGDGEGDDLT